MENMTNFIEKELSLNVNGEKTTLDRKWKWDHLGFSLTYHKESKIRIAQKSVQKMKHRNRELIGRPPLDLDGKSNQKTESVPNGLQMIIWKQWKKPKTKVKKHI